MRHFILLDRNNSLTLREEFRLMVLENRILRRIFGTKVNVQVRDL